MLLHLAVVVVAPGCVLAGWWQVTVALSGNLLSYLYSVEWPVFAIISVVMWWQLVHDDPEAISARRMANHLNDSPVRVGPPPPDDHAGDEGPSPAERSVRRRDEESEELRAYNDYLAGLAAGGGIRSWRNQHSSH